jgi:hypothetical protein
MNEICRILGRLESHINNLNDTFQDFKASLEELKDRVHHLERQHYLWRGGITTMLAVGTLLGSACDLILRWYLHS